MKNWEKIYKMMIEGKHFPFYNEIYDWCPIEIRKQFDEDYEKDGYTVYENERELFDTEFKECFISFLKYVKHWPLDSLIKLTDLECYARSTASNYIRDYRRGDNTFELWLLDEEGSLKRLKKPQEVKIYEEDVDRRIDELPGDNKKAYAYLMYLFVDPN